MNKFQERTLCYDFVVIGGGMAGIAAAVTASRRGLRTALIQDRPVLGGNASKEVRLWLLGGDGGGNNAYFRETGLMEELRLENLYWNPDGEAEPWHVILHTMVMEEKRLDLYLNTVVTELKMDGSRIQSVKGFTLASEIWTTFTAPFFLDSTGDGTIGYLAGVPYSVGQESREEYGESLAPAQYDPGTLGNTIMFLAKDAGHPVEFKRPSWAYRFEEKDLQHREHTHRQSGIYFWWIEYGGESDTIHENEKIKHELWRIVYGIWDHLKNDPEHRPETRNLELEWVGTIPGKRESRRLAGPHKLTEQDIMNQTEFPDAVAYGGWSLDHHPPGGFWDKEREPSRHFHHNGLYNIPLRSLYAVNVENLFFAGRDISATHVAMCSTRVMLTAAQMGQAVGAAVQECLKSGSFPAGLTGEQIGRIQQSLLKEDHYIVGVQGADPDDLARQAQISASSVHAGQGAEDFEPERALRLELDGDGNDIMFPVLTGRLDEVRLLMEGAGVLEAELWQCDKKRNFYPAVSIGKFTVEVKNDGARGWTVLPLQMEDLPDGWYFLHVKGAGLALWASPDRLPGFRVMKYYPRGRRVYSRWPRLDEVGAPYMRIEPEPALYTADKVANGYSRPYHEPNLWVSARTDFTEPETLTLKWQSAVRLNRLQLAFDSDLDKELKNQWVPYPFHVIANCVKDYAIEAKVGGEWRQLAEVSGNYQRFRVHRFETVETDAVRISFLSTWGTPYAGVYEIRAYNE